jgi:hypothetical protein
MFRIPLLVAIALAIAFGGGIALTRYATGYFSGFGAIEMGAWQAFPKAQTSQADPYAKNHRARTGILLLGSVEGLTFYATHDDAGEAFNPGCTYAISGKIPPARFWTLTTGTPENLPNAALPGLPSALNSQTVLYGRDGSVNFDVSSRAQPGNWLAVSPSRRFTLILTLFDTPVAGNSGLIELSMPSIVRTSCGDA